MRTTLTIQNYRCFVRPTTIEIGRDFTCFVGVNNAGKSSLLRFLFEFRNVFDQLRNDKNSSYLIQALSSGASVPLNQVPDPQEIFSNRRTKEGIRIDLEFHYDADERIATDPRKVNVSISRELILRIAFESNSGVRFENAPANFIQPPALARPNQPAQRVALGHFFSVVSKLANTLYIGPFRNTINVGGSTNYLDITIGEQFINQFRSLKHGASKYNNERILGIENDIRRIFEFESLHIEPTYDNKSLNIEVNRKTYQQHELGSGLLQFIVVLVNASIKNPCYILIDEPELGLHPKLQHDFLTTLASYASEGVWFSTHNLGLARSVAEKIYSVHRRGDGDSEVLHLNDIPRMSTFLGEMSFSSFQELGFDSLLLVEGVTDVTAIQQMLRKIGREHQFVVLPLLGAIHGEMREQLQEILRITTKVAALIDSERTDEGAPLEKARQAFVECCKSLDIYSHVLQRRATENYFPDRAVKAVFGEHYDGLSPFEKLASKKLRWQKRDNWRLALAMTVEELMSTDLGEFLKNVFR